MLTRKQFLLNSIALASGATLLGSKAFAEADLVTPTFDLHTHPGAMHASLSSSVDENAPALKTIGGMNAAHLSGAFFALVADTRLLERTPTGIKVNGMYKSGEGWAEYKRQLKVMKDFLAKANVRVSSTSADLKKKDRVAAYLAVEGGDFLESSVEHLEESYKDGIRSIQVVHYAPNDLGDLQTADAMHNGLSESGKNIVRKMNELGMVIDVAHAAFKTVKDVVSITTVPIILSHSVLQMEPDRPIAARAISKDHAKAVAETGGVIGMWPSGFNRDFDEYVDNTKRMVDVVGIDHVGIGTDMDANFKPVLSDYSQYALLAKALGGKGFSATEVAQIMGGNAARVLKKVVDQG